MSTSHADSKSHGLGFYAGILVALMVLTFLTYFTARQMHTGALHLPIAFVIAIVKASLVVWFFMHLKEHGSSNQAFFVTSLFFVGLMIVLIMGDVIMRWPTANPNLPAFQEMKGAW